ncbi:Myc-type, basic helix-loop-helix (bHLH) domain-containing protein, partial [Cynara cardunculus var. scolymus]
MSMTNKQVVTSELMTSCNHWNKLGRMLPKKALKNLSYLVPQLWWSTFSLGGWGLTALITFHISMKAKRKWFHAVGRVQYGGMKVGVPWMTSMERPSQSSSIHNHPSTTFSSLSSSHPSSAPKNQYFLDAVKSAMSVREEEYNDEEFVIKKEPSFHHKGASPSLSLSQDEFSDDIVELRLYKFIYELIGGISVKVGTTNPDQKPDSPRSKHSATEQRRRSKINDRHLYDDVVWPKFSMLRGIIPHGDQKRDKASFLLEVIEYIQFLQEKVHKYEDSYQGWTNKPPNMTSLNNIPTKSLVDHQPQLPNNTSRPAFVLDSNTSSLDAIKETTNTSFPVAESFHTHICAPDTASKAQPQLLHSRSCTTDCTGDKLCSGLTQALRRSGVDLSQANISVQIDLGKRSSNASSISPPDLK